jgi:hypothetical protein
VGGGCTCCSLNTIKGYQVIDEEVGFACKVLRGDDAKLLKCFGRNSSERSQHLVPLIIAGG